jgi:hypothetical protein
MSEPDDDDRLAFQKTVEHGLTRDVPAKIDLIVDVLDRAELGEITSRLMEAGYDHDVWDDPVSRSISVYVGVEIRPALDEIVRERDKLRQLLAGLTAKVDDWGASI